MYAGSEAKIKKIGIKDREEIIGTFTVGLKVSMKRDISTTLFLLNLV